MSYRIQKNIYKAKKPLWMQCLLFNIMPDLYDPRPSKEECQKNMNYNKKTNTVNEI